MADVVLVTGVSRYIGGRFVRRLTDQGKVSRVIATDVVPPTHDIGGAEFVRADIRNPMVGKIIAQSGVDTVVHLNVLATPTSAGGRVMQKEINVIGTMQLLAACQKASSVQRLVVKSTGAVYGSSPRDPALFTEDMAPKVMPRAGFGKDSVEVEGYVRGFGRRRPDAQITMLRMANVVGPGIRTSLTDYFTMPVVPTPLGFDGRLQLLHEDDALEALIRASTGPGAGTVNVAGAGILSLRQAVRMTGRPWVPVPAQAGGPLAQLVRTARWADFPSDQMALLSWGRVLDTTRMREVLGFDPEYSTREAFTEFVEAHRTHGVLPGLVPHRADQPEEAP